METTRRHKKKMDNLSQIITNNHNSKEEIVTLYNKLEETIATKKQKGKITMKKTITKAYIKRNK